MRVTESEYTSFRATRPSRIGITSMPRYSTFRPVGGISIPERVIVPSCVPRAVHSWTTRSSRTYARRVSNRRSGNTAKMLFDRPRDLVPADVDVAGDVVLEDGVVRVHRDDRFDVVAVPRSVVAVNELLELLPVHRN